jgi:hypothetical protein
MGALRLAHPTELQGLRVFVKCRMGKASETKWRLRRPVGRAHQQKTRLGDYFLPKTDLFLSQ